nr:hypothetical protein [Saprospiraceae bacterium]
MRKWIWSCFFVVLSVAAYSQVEKGSWLIDFNGHTGYESEQEIISPQLYAKIGYFPTNFLAVGARLGGSGFLQENNNFGNVLYAGFARYYINPQSENFHFFGEMESGLLVDYEEGMDKQSRFFFKPLAGMSYKLIEGLGLEVGLGLTFMESLNTSQIRYHGLSFELGWKATISHRSAEALEETEQYFGRGKISLAASFNLNNSFDQFIAALRSSTETELNSEALRFTSLSESNSNLGIIDVGFGFFLSDRTMFNIGLGIVNYGSSDFEPATTLFSISPGLRYYLPLGDGRTNMYLQGAYEFGGVNQSGLGAESTYNYINGGVGLTYMIGPAVAIELGADYGKLSGTFIQTSRPIKFYYGLRIFL